MSFWDACSCNAGRFLFACLRATLTYSVLAGDIAIFGAVYRFCHDTVQPPLPEIARILAEYMKWMPEACRSQAMSLCSVLIKE